MQKRLSGPEPGNQVMAGSDVSRQQGNCVLFDMTGGSTDEGLTKIREVPVRAILSFYSILSPEIDIKGTKLEGAVEGSSPTTGALASWRA
ncbi:hypothetical protein PoB_006024300 [Plakobranchus ocellatus]|uniref:Uncharacterized protein n=1 Tax=Plakobranchus ocellatus TaxID=259542 RepID=A0AAV4CPF2_9GAST|nr:hypothetical protein PoB_006024300 [Plakobranchus ocellatus]